MIKKIKELDLKIIRKGLIPDYKGDIPDKKYVFVDLDSIFSIFLNDDNKIPEDYDDRVEIATDIVDIIKVFLSIHIRYSEVFFFYRLEKGSYFRSIYSEWNKERYKRFDNDEIVDFLHKILINNIRKLSNKTENVKIVKCRDDTILTIKDYIKNYFEDDIVIHSRDPHYLCLFSIYNKITIYDGKSIMTANNYKIMKSKSLPSIDYTLLPFYFMVCGLKRNEYKGYHNYGPKKTLNYIKENLESIIDKNDTISLELKKYQKIFYFKRG